MHNGAALYYLSFFCLYVGGLSWLLGNEDGLAQILLPAGAILAVTLILLSLISKKPEEEQE